MYNQLKFVQGAVAKKDFNPVLTHFFIDKGTIIGCNGRMTIGSPIDIDITATPKAASFVKAIESCSGTISIHLTPARRLAICSGKFKAYVECLEDDIFPSVPEVKGEPIPVQGNLLDVLKQLHPFVGIDASRMWSNSLLFTPDGCAFATNNIVLVQKYIGNIFPVSAPVCLPYDVIREILRLKENPQTITFDNKGIFFSFSEGRWMHTTLRINEWPIDPSSIFTEYKSCPQVPDGVFEALHKVLPFADMDALFFFRQGNVCTEREEGMGASVAVAGTPELARFNINQFLLLEGVATHIDFTPWPNPCPFFGENIRGIISGAYA